MYERPNNGIVKDKVDAVNQHIPENNLPVLPSQIRAIKRPVALDPIIGRPAKNVGQRLGHPPWPVKNVETESENTQAAPKPDAAANHIFGELDHQFVAAPAGFGLFNAHAVCAFQIRTLWVVFLIFYSQIAAYTPRSACLAMPA